MVSDGAKDGDAFVQSIKTQLAPTLSEGDVVVLDNVPAHKKQEAEQAVHDCGDWLLFLPPYSPDLNPIELAFSKLNAHIKRIAPRTVDDLCKSTGQICKMFEPSGCANFFKEDGYGPV